VTSKKNPEIESLQAVYEALKDLSPDIRVKVRRGVFATNNSLIAVLSVMRDNAASA
jgi:hypothetical protein